VATLNVDESLFLFAEDPAQLDDPFLAGAVSPALLQYWRSPEYREKIAKDPNTPKFHAAHKNAMPNLKALHDAGVRIGFGTDSGAQPVRIPGWAEHRELELMVRAGLKPMEAIVAATRGSAAMLGVDDRGTLEQGKRADFLVLSGDPLQDIRNTRKLVSIWHNGREIKPRVAILASK
jgi:imidazolonepropionase-like amidohydrolase